MSSPRPRSQENPREMLHSHVGLSAGPRGCSRRDPGTRPRRVGAARLGLPGHGGRRLQGRTRL